MSPKAAPSFPENWAIPREPNRWLDTAPVPTFCKFCGGVSFGVSHKRLKLGNEVAMPPEEFRMRFLLQLDAGVQRKALRRAADRKRVFAGQQLPGIGLLVVNGEITRIDADTDVARFARLQRNLAPSNEALRRLAGAFWQRSIDLSDFHALAFAAVFQSEIHGDAVCGSKLETRITEGGIGKAETKRK